MRSFTEELVVDLQGVPVPLLTLTGACLGTELRLASDNLPFGPVVLGSRSTKRLQLENTGDVGTKFIWDTRALGEHFSVFPAEGFLAPHQVRPLLIMQHVMLAQTCASMKQCSCARSYQSCWNHSTVVCHINTPAGCQAGCYIPPNWSEPRHQGGACAPQGGGRRGPLPHSDWCLHDLYRGTWCRQLLMCCQSIQQPIHHTHQSILQPMAAAASHPERVLYRARVCGCARKW